MDNRYIIYEERNERRKMERRERKVRRRARGENRGRGDSERGGWGLGKGGMMYEGEGEQSKYNNII